MPDYRVKMPNEEIMADLVLFVLEHARSSLDEYVFGPIAARELMRDGLRLSGATDDLLASIQKRFPDSEIFGAA